MKTKMLLSLTAALISLVAPITQAVGQEIWPLEAHDINVEEYLLLLNTVASQSIKYGLYDVEDLGDEIVAQIYPFSFRKRNQIFYVAAQGVKLTSSLFGLTELQAMCYCNWVENGSPRALPKALVSIERGSYDLTGKNVVVNEEAQHHIIFDVLHPGCFIITTRSITTRSSDGEELVLPAQTTAPLTMFGRDS